MLHIHSFNMGMTAGMAWKAAGQEYVPFEMLNQDAPMGIFVLELLELVKRHDNDDLSREMMFLPSSFLEGFHEAFTYPRLMNM